MAADWPPIYQAVTQAQALPALERLQSQWDKKFPVIAKSWRATGRRVTPLLELPAQIRQAVCKIGRAHV